MILGLSNFRLACANGYLGEVAARGKLPDELLHWMLDTCKFQTARYLYPYIDWLMQHQRNLLKI